jgi:phytoene dehydrogenase-like protein
MAAGHRVGWPAAAGGSRAVADALVSLLEHLGGRIETGVRVDSAADLPPARAVLFSTSPSAFERIAGDRLPGRYRRALRRFRHGPGSFKVDWALDGPIPWTDPACHRAGTLHLGGPLEEVAAAEATVVGGRHPPRPFVLVAQQSRFDPARAPDGRHTAWGYCHVPAGSTVDMTDRIEAQVERFAPGFGDLILERHVMGPDALEARNPNYIDGDIAGGAFGVRQLVARPALRLDPYRSPAGDLYLCSASVPPGGGVHGMCGYHAARSALRHSLR